MLDAGCNIAESRMAVLGGEFALMLLVNGEADTIDGVKTAWPIWNPAWASP